MTESFGRSRRKGDAMSRLATLAFWSWLCWLGTVAVPGQAQEVVDQPDYGELLLRLETQQAAIASLQQQLQQLGSAGNEEVRSDDDNAGLAAASDGGPRRIPLVTEVGPCDPLAKADDAAVDFFCDYDRGFVIQPFAPASHPFELRMNGWIQFRHTAFARDVESWTDRAGVTRDVRNRNNFDIERARLLFSGHAVSPQLTYFLQLDGDTDGQDIVDFFDYWWAWRFNETFQIQMGKRKVPASLQWQLTARQTRFVDRPMANDFFRPDRTVGLFAIGDPTENLHYELMIGNGYRTANRSPSELDNRFAMAALAYWDPWGSFGSGLVDWESSDEYRSRLGHSFVYAPSASLMQGIPVGEADFVRLADGTRLTDVGVLGPATRVSDFDLYFYGIDWFAKWKGWSLSTEVFFRWIQDLGGLGDLPHSDLFQRGFYVEGGKFLIEKRLDLNGRYSQISGLAGNSSEYAIGGNWYPLGKPQMKLSWDITWLDGSALNNTTSDILAGDDGILFRTQFQAEF
jgi:hypothetical protein